MSMPKRSKEHQIEDLSINELKRLLPRQWVYREKSRDYGIDGEIEIFDENDHATGMIFLVQLKATDSFDPKIQTRVQLDNATINYYNSLELPTLIVRYVEETKNVYIKWAHSIDRYKQKEGAKSFTFHMTEENLWHNDIPQEILQTIKKITTLKTSSNLLPLKIYSNFQFEDSAKMASYRLRLNLRTILDKHNNLAKLVTTREDAIVVININNETLHLDICGIGGCYFHSLDIFSYTYEKLIGDIFLALTVGLLKLNKNYNALNIFETLVSDGKMYGNPQVMMPIIQEYAKDGNSAKVIELWKSIPKKFKDDLLIMQYQLITNVSSEQTNSQDMSEHFLLEQVKKYEEIEDLDLLGVAYYNYASFLRTKNYKKSLKYFIKALKNNEYYQKEDYIYKAIAGLLWDLGKYTMASKCYKKGLDIREDVHHLALYADSLMFQGKYLEARNKFLEYFDKKKENIHPEWCLKEIVLGIMVDYWEITDQKRNYFKAMNTQTIKNCKGQSIPDREYEYIIEKIDALNPLCHFNLAVSYSQNNNDQGATVSFLICALVNRNDKSSWLNSIIGAFKCEAYTLIHHMVYCGYDFCGEEFLDLIYTFLEDNPELESNNILNLIDEIVEEYNIKNDKISIPTIRLFNGTNFEKVNFNQAIE